MYTSYGRTQFETFSKENFRRVSEEDVEEGDTDEFKVKRHDLEWSSSNASLFVIPKLLCN